jgi:hypothetical protein
MNDITLSGYIAQYRNGEREALELLSVEFEDQGRYRDTTNAVATTWFISFEQVRERDRVAADYLSFMACIASNGTKSGIAHGACDPHFPCVCGQFMVLILVIQTGA